MGHRKHVFRLGLAKSCGLGLPSFFPIILGGAFWQTMAYLHLKKKNYIGIYENSSGANKASWMQKSRQSIDWA